jgi:hypothetical protein
MGSMEEFIHYEKLIIFKRQLADPSITDERRRMLARLLALEEAKRFHEKDDGHAEPAGPVRIFGVCSIISIFSLVSTVHDQADSSWPVRFAKCGHIGTVTAATADLAWKQLPGGSCDHRQPFASETIARARRRSTGRGARASRYAACAKHGGFAAIPVNYQGIWLLLTDR